MAEIISSVAVLWLNAKATLWVDDTKARRLCRNSKINNLCISDKVYNALQLSFRWFHKDGLTLIV